MVKKSLQERIATIVFINAIIAFIVCSVAAFCIDAYVKHPIPKQEGTKEFVLAEAETPYSDAAVLSSYSGYQFCDIFLVEQDGTFHLLYFSHHFQTGRRALVADVTIDDVTPNQNVNIGTKLKRIAVEIENGKIVNTGGSVTNVTSKYFGTYLMIGFVFTALESTLLAVFLRKKNKGKKE